MDDKLTKWIRPAIIFSGILVIVVNYMIVPVIYAALGETEWVTLKLPLEFWATWGTVSGAFVVGRTAEKMGKSNKTTSVLTGSKK